MAPPLPRTGSSTREHPTDEASPPAADRDAGASGASGTEATETETTEEGPAEPINPYIRAYISNHIHPILARTDATSTVEAMQSLSMLSLRGSMTRGVARAEGMGEMITVGAEAHERILLASPTGRRPAAELVGLLQTANEGIARGERRAYFEALQLCFLIAHQTLTTGNFQAAGQILTHATQLLGDYLNFLNSHTELSPEERLRYGFAAARIGRTLYDRVTEVQHFVQQNQELVMNYHMSLAHTYEGLVAICGTLPEDRRDDLRGISLEVEMRSALMNSLGDPTQANRAAELAAELNQYYHDHPIPDPLPTDEATRWIHLAGSELLGDPAFTGAVTSLSSAAPVAPPTSAVDSISIELYQMIAASVDMANEEEATVVQSRYEALSAVMTAVMMNHPQEDIPHYFEYLANLSDPAALAAELESLTAEPEAGDAARASRGAEGAEGNAALREHLREIFDRVRGEHNYRWLVNQARTAAEHVLEVQRGAGRRLIRIVTETRDRSVREVERITASLGADATEEQILARYNQVVNNFVRTIMDRTSFHLDSIPDHELGAVFQILNTVAQTRGEIGLGISIDENLINRAQSSIENFESATFGLSRAWRSTCTWRGGLSLFFGILVAEMIPTMMLARAGAGAFAVRGITLARAGQLTLPGAIAAGMLSGVTMSFINAGFSNLERANLGLQTNFWRDFGSGALLNGVTFGLTMGAGRLISRNPSTVTAASRSRSYLSLASAAFRHRLYTAGVGTLIGFGVSVGARRVTSGEWATSWQEVFENVINMLAWEFGSGALHFGRTTAGIRSELRGRRYLTPRPASGPGRRAAFFARVRQGIAGLGNSFFTTLGAERIALIRQLAAEMVRANPDLIVDTEYIARRLALTEAMLPGTLEGLLGNNSEILRTHVPRIIENPHSRELVFERRTDPRMTGDVLVRMVRHLEVMSPRDPNYPGRFIPTDPAEVIQLQVDPESGRITAIDNFSLGTPVANPIIVEASRDGHTGRMVIRPRAGTTEPLEINVSSVLDFSEKPSAPFRWNQEFFDSTLEHTVPTARLEPLARIGESLSRAYDFQVQIDPVTGRLIQIEGIAGGRVLSLDLLPRDPAHPDEPVTFRRTPSASEWPLPLTFRARLEPESTHLTFPALREHEGRGESAPRPILDLSTGEFSLRDGTPSTPPPAPPTPPPATPPASPAGSAPATPPARPRTRSGSGSSSSGTGSGPDSPPSTGSAAAPRPRRATPPPPPASPPAARRTPPPSPPPAPPAPPATPPSSDTGSAPRSAGRARRHVVPPGTPPTGGSEPSDPEPAVSATPAVSRRALLDAVRDVYHNLIPGESTLAIEPNLPDRSREAIRFVVTPLGEAFGFTEVGFDKHSRRYGTGVNEDAFGVAVDPHGRTLIALADAMGAEGSRTDAELASAEAVDSFIRHAMELPEMDGPDSLGLLHQAAHHAIRSVTDFGITTLTTLRVNRDATVDFANTGDSLFFLIRNTPEGIRVIRPILPGNVAGMIRMGTKPGAPGPYGIYNTLEMNRHPSAHRSSGLGGARNPDPPHLDSYHPFKASDGIMRGRLWLHDESGAVVPVHLQRGDRLLAAGDGLTDIFTTHELGTLGPLETFGRRLYEETTFRQRLFAWAYHVKPTGRFRLDQSLAEGPLGPAYPVDLWRASPLRGRYGEFVEKNLEIYDAESGGTHLAHIHGDNITGVLFEFGHPDVD